MCDYEYGWHIVVLFVEWKKQWTLFFKGKYNPKRKCTKKGNVPK